MMRYSHESAESTGMTRRGFLKLGTVAATVAGLGLMPRVAFGDGPLSAADSSIDSIIAGMSRKQKVEQMLMPDFRQWKGADGIDADFTVMNDDVRSIIDRYDFGGVILFANNVKETEQTLRLCMDMQEAATANTSQENYGDIPLLLTIDQEGGIVYRLGSGTALPGNMAVGATRSEDDARQCGEVIGRELSALKLNVNFAPVFDTNSNPNNPVIGLRSFGSRPDLVSELGVPMMEGTQKYGVATAAKHFPGHGDAGTDSHTGLPLVDKSRDQLEEVEFVPFKAAIANGVDMVMTAHIQFPQVESSTAVSTGDQTSIYLPATLSSVFMTDILRNEMGFEGVAVTDALNMDAISKNFDYIDAVKRAFLAGVDIALMPVTLRSNEDLAALDSLIEAIVEDVDGLSDDRLNVSVRRILELKEKRGILRYASDAGSFEDNLAIANKQVGSEENRSIEREVSADAVTVVKNEGGILPFKPESDDHVLLVAAWSNEQPGMELSMRRLMAEGVIQEGVTYESINYAESYGTPDEALGAILPKIPGSSYVVVISEVGKTANLDPGRVSGSSTYVPTRVVQAANEARVPVAVMSISLPYDTVMYTDAPAVCAVFGNKGMDPTEGLQPSEAFGPNVPAGIEVIFGGHAAQGKMPVDAYAVKVENGSVEFDTGTVVYPFGFGIEYGAVASGTPSTDVSKLQAAIDDVVKNVLPHEGEYDESTFAALQSALVTAKQVASDADATQDEVDSALKALISARQALKPAGTQPVEPTDGSDSEEADKEDQQNESGEPAGTELPQTGDPLGIVTAAAGIVGAAALGAGMLGSIRPSGEED